MSASRKTRYAGVGLGLLTLCLVALGASRLWPDGGESALSVNANGPMGSSRQDLATRAGANANAQASAEANANARASLRASERDRHPLARRDRTRPTSESGDRPENEPWSGSESRGDTNTSSSRGDRAVPTDEDNQRPGRTLAERDALVQSERALQDEIGDEEYDQRLYDKGENNRVKVRWVSEMSAAGQAGLMNGDILLSYAGQPVYKVRGVRSLANHGGSTIEVPIVYQRGDQIFHTTITTTSRNAHIRGSVHGMSLSPEIAPP
jgi:hypothetical protein